MSSHEQRLCTEFGSHENVIDSRIYMRECADVVTAELSGVGGRFNYTARPHARLVGEFYKNQLWTCRTVYRCSISPTSVNIPHIAVQFDGRTTSRSERSSLAAPIITVYTASYILHHSPSHQRRRLEVETRLRIRSQLTGSPTNHSAQSEENFEGRRCVRSYAHQI